MGNSKEWFSAGELLGIGELPTSPQGVNKKARSENWKKRKKAGVQGNAVEYYVGDMPENVQRALGFKPTQKETAQEPSLESQVNERLKTIDKIMAAVSTLEQKVKELEEPTLDSLPDTLDNAEKRLIRWFRQCNKDRQAMLLSSAEVLADMTLNEQKESEEPSKAREVA
ncbi:DNA-binding protein [Actinobacillus capsulatus]|uniref:DNA-binding protein n=1 Tax=Actinobacillus capsulatus TaxID=717 RepID=UPI000368DC0D|nr:DNA-binding protein [Actinobacillus capsulatus]